VHLDACHLLRESLEGMFNFMPRVFIDGAAVIDIGCVNLNLHGTSRGM
jgi:hypothetical protein